MRCQASEERWGQSLIDCPVLHPWCTHGCAGETLTGCMGTAAYAAPEVLGEQAYDSGADVWSAGVVAYTLLSGGRPFWGKTFAELVRAVRHNAPCFRGPPWEGVSPEAMGFVDMLLARDPRLRPSPVQALCESPSPGQALARTALYSTVHAHPSPLQYCTVTYCTGQLLDS